MNLEEQADELLKEYAREQNIPLRRLGILDKRRLQTVAKREVPLSELKSKAAWHRNEDSE